ncbi:PREDICTED: solute carrier family 35 member B1-like [Branchiostoma belcheri]|uniref:Solute carrier family 35 member B1 n=1 Tax=Branchiostoma belcheri TaxID=7741 RepID=A0A6P4Z8M0_BRABE|nr:PREDICTED: solute carrier family 35 member B1-like [Branchiostoma belcheri]
MKGGRTAAQMNSVPDSASNTGKREDLPLEGMTLPDSNQQPLGLTKQDVETGGQSQAGTSSVPANGGMEGLWNRLSERTRLLTCFFGIFTCYFYYGIIQEKITRGTYGEDKDKFRYVQSLVFIQCIVNAAFAKMMCYFAAPGVKDTTPNWLYGICATTYMGAMLASNQALQHVNYPTQVLGKSCKPIPVLILGVLLARKRYPLAKYLFVLLIVAGVAIFVYKDNVQAKADDHVFGWGEILLLASLTMDGLTGVSQEKMRGEHQTNSHHMMYNMNFWSIGILAVCIGVTGEVFSFLKFLEKYPYVLGNMFIFSLTSALGQLFIFVTVTNFGPLTCSIITTTRKFFTILASVIIFQNPMLPRQWLGVLLVFSGLAGDSYFGKAKKTKENHK